MVGENQKDFSRGNETKAPLCFTEGNEGNEEFRVQAPPRTNFVTFVAFSKTQSPAFSWLVEKEAQNDFSRIKEQKPHFAYEGNEEFRVRAAPEKQTSLPSLTSVKDNLWAFHDCWRTGFIKNSVRRFFGFQ